MGTQSPNIYLKKLKQEVLSCLAGQAVKVYLFGSRARGDEQAISDVDIGIIPPDCLPPGTLSTLRERIENLNIPYKVEVVNLLTTSAEFREQALRNAQIWKA